MAKIHAYLPLILAAALLIAAASYGIATSQPANGVYDADGDGLIEVANLEQLNAIRYDLDGDGSPNSGADAYAAAFPVSDGDAVCDSGCHGYELARALDFDAADSYAAGAANAKWTTGAGWLPIGVSEDARFGAIFDGNGHTIANLHINRTTEFDDPGAVGLFGYTGNSAIRNIGMVDVDVAGGGSAGGLTGVNGGEMTEIYVTGNVEGGEYVGGLAGENAYSIDECYAASNVSANDGGAAGGLVGHNDGRITTSYATGNVSGGSAGGLAGHSDGPISSSYATGKVSGKSAGGLVGSSSSRGAAVGSIITSYATGNVSGVSSAGGLVGYNNGGQIIASYATGNVSADNPYDRKSAGGLVGYNAGPISSSYATGEATGSPAGGLVGYNGGPITASYATGNVSADSDRGRDPDGGGGGLAGYNNHPISVSYATGNVTGSSAGGLVGRNDGAGPISASYATGKVTASYAGGGLVGYNASSISISYATGNVSADSDGSVIGGLVGRNYSGVIIRASYWDIQTSGQTAGVGEGLPPEPRAKPLPSCRSLTATKGYTPNGIWT